MNGLKRKEEEIGLVDLDTEKADGLRDKEVTLEEKTVRKNKTVWMALVCIIAGSLAVILSGTLLFHMSLIVAGMVVVIEAGIAAVLNNSDFGVHIIVMSLQISIGFLFGQALLMILAAVYYFILLVALKLMELDI